MSVVTPPASSDCDANGAGMVAVNAQATAVAAVAASVTVGGLFALSPLYAFVVIAIFGI
jgi:hypothetical protein